MRMLGQLLLAVTVLSCGGDKHPVTGVPGGQITPPVIGFSKRSALESGITIPYQVWAPQNFTATRQWPILVALAGSAERGSDGEKQVAVGMGPLVRSQPNFPAVVIFPQVPLDEAGRFAFEQAVYTMISDVSRAYNGDPARVYLTGLSFGGTESFTLLYANTAPFAGFIGISGGICPRCIQSGATLDVAQALVAQKLKAFPIWLFQGDQDTNTPVATTRALRSAFLKVGSTSLKYTEYAGAGHTIWDRVYETQAVWDWLFQQRR